MMFVQIQEDVAGYSLGLACLLVLGLMTVGCAETAGSGGSGGSAGSGGTGGTPECMGPEDCDDENECSEDTCSMGVCENTHIEDGTACGEGAGTCQTGSCVGTFDCSEQGILDAIDVKGGPHTFDCDGPTTVVTNDAIVIGKDVILDGEGNLTVDGDDDHVVFATGGRIVTVELRGFVITRGARGGGTGSGVFNVVGRLILTNCTVSGNAGSGVGNVGGELTLVNSTVSANAAGVYDGGGIVNWGGELTLVNSTVSANTTDGSGGGIASVPYYHLDSTLTIISSTIAGNQSAGGGDLIYGQNATIASSLVDGDCSGTVASNGYNIESTGDTCGFDQPTDQVNVSGDDLKLGELADNGGPTMTHALGAGSVAIDQIPAVDCVDADGAPLTTDQRGERRPAGAESKCDIGSVEAQASN